MSWFVLVSPLIGVENGVSDNHEAYYCKTKVVTLVSRNAHGIQMNQSENKANPCSRHKAREKAREHVVVVLASPLIGVEMAFQTIMKLTIA